METDAMVNVVTDLMYFDFNECSGHLFDKVFGEELGKHLFAEYVDGKRDFLKWFGFLDMENREKIIMKFLELRRIRRWR